MSQYINYKNINIHFTDRGSGKSIVLLHGFLENMSMWNDLSSNLELNNRVIAIDLLGHGKTECLGYIHTMENMADAVKAVLSTLKIKTSIIIGHSMGGYVALEYSNRYSDSVSGLCLVNSTATPDSDERKLNRDRAIIAVKQNFKTFVSLSIINLFAKHNQGLLVEDIALVKREALKTPVQGIIAALEGMKCRQDRTDVLKNNAIKKMMIVGKEDHILDYNSLQNQIKNSNVKVVEFPDGHMSYIENKEAFSYNIMHFIENL